MPFRYRPSLVSIRQLHNCPLYCISSPIRLVCTAATMRPSWLQASCRRSPRRCYHSEPSSCVLSRQLLASTVLAVLSGTNLVPLSTSLSSNLALAASPVAPTTSHCFFCCLTSIVCCCSRVNSPCSSTIAQFPLIISAFILIISLSSPAHFQHWTNLGFSFILCLGLHDGQLVFPTTA